MDEAIAEEVFHKYYKPIRTWMINSQTDSPQVAEDVASKTIVKYLDAVSKGKVIRNVESYIWKIARNARYDEYRDENKLNKQFDACEKQLRESERDHTEIVHNREDAREILKILWPALSQHQEKVVLAYYFEGACMEDIAKQFNCKKNSIRVALNRARNNMRSNIHLLDEKMIPYQSIV